MLSGTSIAEHNTTYVRFCFVFLFVFCEIVKDSFQRSSREMGRERQVRWSTGGTSVRRIWRTSEADWVPLNSVTLGSPSLLGVSLLKRAVTYRSWVFLSFLSCHRRVHLSLAIKLCTDHSFL